MDISEAYRECERITRTRARNFSYGIRLLPVPKRRALSAVYAFARRVDDIGDGELSQEDKAKQLRRAREDIHSASLRSSDPVLVALTDAARGLPVPLDAFDELIDGCEADVRGDAYRTFGDLVHYCRCVAGSIGRLSLGVFEASDQNAARPRADALGVALQLTNILRDIPEDLASGRVYLPEDDLIRFGVWLDPADPAAVVDHQPGIPDLIRFEARRAHSWYETGLGLLPMLDRRSRACCVSMVGVYLGLLRRIASAPRTAMRERTSLSSWQKAGVAARSLGGMSP